MQVKVNIEVDDIIEEIIIAELTDYYDMVAAQEPEHVDLLSALSTVLREYMTEDEFIEWSNAQNPD